MQIFKLGMKIIRKNIPMILIYVAVFLSIVIAFSFAGTHDQAKTFSDRKSDIAFFSEEDTPLVEGLKHALSRKVNFVALKDNTEAIQDALYFESVTYVIRIPKGFTAQFLQGGGAKLEKQTAPNSIYGAYVDLTVDRYLNTARMYLKNDPGISEQELAARLSTDLSKNAAVTMSTDASGKNTGNGYAGFTVFYFTYMAYVLPMVLIFGIASMMEVSHDRDLSRRSFCSPVSSGSYNFQLILANCAFSAAVWAILLVPCAVLDRGGFFTANTVFLVLNSFVFLLCSSTFAFLIGSIVKGRQSISAAANVFALGPCFISGVFIQQKYLNDFVLKIASFTPQYWYVTAGNRIAQLTRFGADDLLPSLVCILVELGFAAAFLLLGLVAGKKRRVEE